jgi:hypothetical protein
MSTRVRDYTHIDLLFTFKIYYGQIVFRMMLIAKSIAAKPIHE